MRHILIAAIAALSVPAAALAQAGPVQMSFLPGARSGQTNTPVTVFATVINSHSTALDCAPRFGGLLGTLPGGASGQLRFFPWDGSEITGTANQTVTIAAGGRQDYVVEASFTGEFAGRVQVNFRCSDGDGGNFDLRARPLVNSPYFRITNAASHDIVMVGATLTNDGISRVGETGPRAALLTVAAVNIGAPAANLEVIGGIAGFNYLDAALDISICETDTAGICLAPESDFVSIADWPTNEIRYFAVRARVPPRLGLPLYPDILRLMAVVYPAPAAGGGNEFVAEVPISGTGRFGLTYDAETSSAIEAEPSIPTDIRVELQGSSNNGLVVGFECQSETNGDLRIANSFLTGLVTEGSSDPFINMSAFGTHTSRDFSLDEYQQPFVFEPFIFEILPNGAHGGLIGPFGSFLIALGTGDADETLTDTEIGVEVSLDLAVEFRYRWAGVPELSNDFSEPGRTRCVPIPQQHDAEAPEGVEAIEGDWSLLPGADQPPNLPEGDLQIDPTGAVTIGGVPAGQIDTESTGAGGLTDAIHILFDLDRDGNPNGVVVPLPGSNVSDPNRERCIRVMLFDSPSADADPERDASVTDFLRDPDDIGDGECTL